MSKRLKILVGGGLSVALIAASGAAIATAGDESEQPPSPEQQQLASGAKEQAAILRRAQTARDEWPSTPHENEAAEAPVKKGLIIDEANSRRADPGKGRFGVWIAPASLHRPGSEVEQLICARAVTVAGSPLGFGGDGCVTEEAFAKTGTGSVGSGGQDGAPGFAPHEAVIAGVVPDTITSVTLHLEGDKSIDQKVEGNYFLFDTVETVTGITYDGPSFSYTNRLDACQNCG